MTDQALRVRSSPPESAPTNGHASASTPTGGGTSKARRVTHVDEVRAF
ncbi:hypothetical protein [Stieleria mannarensis]|nr:hypothetical protein [Rhodopirellula sp. JC639]